MKIQESAERTYGEANSFYRKEELYLKDVERRIISGELSSEKDIYDHPDSSNNHRGTFRQICF